MISQTNQYDDSRLRSGRGVRGPAVRIATFLAVATLCFVLAGCIAGMSEKELLGFSPDGKTVLYTTNDKVFIGAVFGMDHIGFGPHSIYLDWRDVDSPCRTGRIKLHGGLIAFPTSGKEKDPPWWAKFSPDSRHVVVEFNYGKVLLMDLKKRTSRRIDGHLHGIEQYEWLSNDEIIFDVDLPATSGDKESHRQCFYRWNIHSPSGEAQLIHEEQRKGPCGYWCWYLSPDRSHLLIGPCCRLCGQCKILNLRSGKIRRFGPGNVRLCGCVWTSDSSAVLCELRTGSLDPDVEKDNAPRQYLLVSPVRSEMILVSHKDSGGGELGGFLAFTPDNQYVVTSRCLLVQPRTWKIIDLKPRITRRWKFTDKLKPELRRSSVPGWFCLWAPDDKIYAVDWQARTFVPLADHGRYAVSPDGKRIAKLDCECWAPSEVCGVLKIRTLNLSSAPTEVKRNETNLQRGKAE